ncbi:trans-2,3-enoyl-CoA reductase, putative [Eimeria tenella]|uniref:Trans-2,3-enoyl-CoA reductase, putative n=1 Tax=Eimeria tenella TaxID=5802 RepID=U6KG46_EIMTE|nr:trans-2,3-enoyl-CoA reductase, putative [Eimeria tenella]CDJ37010.1 trans-2,3-enoyl-CoA reductase, putative [Eimeria tenella]|eukprot:XP_013227848.1 trans-2,3-enoyl-CoA reductase, putative [Eimeria tenella]
MKLYLKKRSGKFLDACEVSDECTVEEFKQHFYRKYRYYPERQWWTVGQPQGPALRGDGLLTSFGVQDGETLFFKDLGVQISWRLVFVLEYFGPLFIFPAFYFFPSVFYGEKNAPPKTLTQTVALWLCVGHFVKRELETLFVHRFSNSTMPIVRVPLNCGHYWLLCAASIGYFLFHPKYQPPFRGDWQFLVYLLAALFVIFEALNFKTHLILRGLRSRGTRQRGIPYGAGFDLVSCANYFWETMAWLVFAVLVSCFTAWLFLVVAFAQMAEWALKKHRNYLKEFKDYPKNRKAIVPFIL